MTIVKPLSEQVILITGATDGLGRRVAVDLAGKGATLLLHGRNPDKGQALLEEVNAASGEVHSRYYNADLSSLAEVKRLASEIRAQESRLDVLVNNAGIGPRHPDSPRQRSADGVELFFAVNYLAGVLLTRLLLPLLRNSAPARIVNVASVGQQELDFENVMLESGYDDARAYRQSKLAQVMFTFDLAEELEGSGVTVNCLHPATLMDTNMVKNSTSLPGAMTTVEQGADALERLIADPALERTSGRYFDGKQEATALSQAYDLEARRRLRNMSLELIDRFME